MDAISCLLSKILDELKKMNKQIAIRTNAISVIEIDTSITTKKDYDLQKIFGSPKGIVATQLTIISLGGGFTINVNNSGTLEAVYGYAIENEEINNIEIIGTGTPGTAKIRIGATM